MPPGKNAPPGKMLPGNLPLENCPMENCPPGKLLTRKLRARKIAPHETFCEFFLISNFNFYGNFRL